MLPGALIFTPNIFQSTLPHGSDRCIDSVQPTISTFQSTLPHGSDAQDLQDIEDAGDISIHAPSRERL